MKYPYIQGAMLFNPIFRLFEDYQLGKHPVRHKLLVALSLPQSFVVISYIKKKIFGKTQIMHFQKMFKSDRDIQIYRIFLYF